MEAASATPKVLVGRLQREPMTAKHGGQSRKSVRDTDELITLVTAVRRAYVLAISQRGHAVQRLPAGAQEAGDGGEHQR